MGRNKGLTTGIDGLRAEINTERRDEKAIY
jgi:hypothetical protein